MSPSADDFDETLHTLKYAAIAGDVKIQRGKIAAPTGPQYGADGRQIRRRGSVDADEDEDGAAGGGGGGNGKSGKGGKGGAGRKRRADKRGEQLQRESQEGTGEDEDVVAEGKPRPAWGESSSRQASSRAGGPETGGRTGGRLQLELRSSQAEVQRLQEQQVEMLRRLGESETRAEEMEREIRAEAAAEMARWLKEQQSEMDDHVTTQVAITETAMFRRYGQNAGRRVGDEGDCEEVDEQVGMLDEQVQECEDEIDRLQSRHKEELEKRDGEIEQLRADNADLQGRVDAGEGAEGGVVAEEEGGESKQDATKKASSSSMDDEALGEENEDLKRRCEMLTSSVEEGQASLSGAQEEARTAMGENDRLRQSLSAVQAEADDALAKAATAKAEFEQQVSEVRADAERDASSLRAEIERHEINEAERRRVVTDSANDSVKSRPSDEAALRRERSRADQAEAREAILQTEKGQLQGQLEELRELNAFNQSRSGARKPTPPAVLSVVTEVTDENEGAKEGKGGKGKAAASTRRASLTPRDPNRVGGFATESVPEGNEDEEEDDEEEEEVVEEEEEEDDSDDEGGDEENAGKKQQTARVNKHGANLAQAVQRGRSTRGRAASKAASKTMSSSANRLKDTLTSGGRDAPSNLVQPKKAKTGAKGKGKLSAPTPVARRTRSSTRRS